VGINIGILLTFTTIEIEEEIPGYAAVHEIKLIEKLIL
jgi:hypothetical protein